MSRWFLSLIALVVGVALLTLSPFVFRKSDKALYEEIFGFRTMVADQNMLFDDFGWGRSREIYLRIHLEGAERDKLLGLPGLRPSAMPQTTFIRRGGQHGFTWWMSLDPSWGAYRPNARIYEADGFNGWKELRIAECLDAGEDSPVSAGRGFYVMAWRREP